MKDIVTFFTTDHTLHWGFFYNLCVALDKKDIVPVFLNVDESNPYINTNFSAISMKSLKDEIFNILKPIAHIQMQDHDNVHRMLFQMAKSNNIPTFHIAHGHLTRVNGEWNLNAGIFDTVADYVCLWGAGMVEGFLQKGVKKENIFITGNPRHDILPIYKKRDAFVPVLCTTATKSTDGMAIFGADPYECFRKFLKIVEAHPEITFHIKQHPTPFDDKEIWDKHIKDFGKELPNISFVTKNIDFVQYLGLFDCCLHFMTSAACDAAVYGIPIIDLRDDFDMVEEFDRILVGESPRSDQFNDLLRDRKSSERIADLILQASGKS